MVTLVSQYFSQRQRKQKVKSVNLWQGPRSDGVTGNESPLSDGVTRNEGPTWIELEFFKL